MSDARKRKEPRCTMLIRVDESLKNLLQQWAAEQNRTVNNYISHALKQHVDDRKKA